jgi:hypothetical protein
MMGEFDRQVTALVERGYPALAGLSEQDFLDLVEPLRAVAPDGEPVAEGRAPLVTHHPAALAKNKCFSLGGSRSGDRRVPAIWISQNAPKLGWCWAGNRHTWLGMASAGGRAA